MRLDRRDIYLEYLSIVEKSWSFLDGLWPDFRRSWAHDGLNLLFELGKRAGAAAGSCYYRP